MESAPPHIPVLLNQVTSLLDPKTDQTYLDLTAGYGGHATNIIQHTGSPKLVTLVDRDVFAFEYLKSKPEVSGATIVQSSFELFVDQLIENHKKFNMILLDLGVSSPQLDVTNRGFSFSDESKLDMRMDQSQSLTAEKVLNTYNKQKLMEILREYGEVQASQVIADEIISSRPLKTTFDLNAVIDRHKGLRQKNLKALVFQAIRIEVNDELGQLKRTLPKLTKILEPDGRLAIISFHSLEDRVVKKYFKSITGNKYESEFELLTKKAIDGKTQDVTNPRSRSAQLRAVAKIKM